MDDPMLSDFLIYHTSDAALGHISVLVEICRSPVICMIIPTYEIQAETMTSLLSYHDLPWEPLLSHSVKPTLFSIWMSSYFFFWDTSFWFVGPMQLRAWLTRITHLMMDDLMSPDFLICHTSDSILGHIPFPLRFIDLYGVACSSPLMRYTLRWWHVCYLIMIL